MQFFTAAVIILASPFLASATPVGPPPPAPTCGAVWPATIGFPININVSQDAGGANKVSNALTFTGIPAGSANCQMVAIFPEGYPVTNTGNSTINVYKVSGLYAGELFGTAKLESSLTSAKKIVINTRKAYCENTMAFRMEIASPDQAGRLAFMDTKDAGLTMTYNC